MYLFKLQNVFHPPPPPSWSSCWDICTSVPSKYIFVQIAKCICPNGILYFLLLLPAVHHAETYVRVSSQNMRDLELICGVQSKYICSNCKIYFSKLTNVSFQIAKCISSSSSSQLVIMLSHMYECPVKICETWNWFVVFIQNILVHIAKCVCLNWKMYLSKLLDVFPPPPPSWCPVKICKTWNWFVVCVTSKPPISNSHLSSSSYHHHNFACWISVTSHYLFR